MTNDFTLFGPQIGHATLMVISHNIHHWTCLANVEKGVMCFYTKGI